MGTRKTTNQPTPRARAPRLASKPARNDTNETAPMVLNAARVLDYAMRERGYTDASLAAAIQDAFGYYISDETLRQKRAAKTALSLPQMDEIARLLKFPVELFVKPFSDTKFFFAQEEAALERGRESGFSEGRDQGIRDSRWIPRTAESDLEILELAGV